MKKDNHINFGTVEIIAIIVGVLVTSYIGYVAHYSANAEFVEILKYIKILVLAMFSALYGPITGAIIGIAGTAFSQNLIPQPMWVISAIGMAMYGAGIGMYCKHYNILAGKFGFREAILIETVCIIDNIVVFTFYTPLANFFSQKTDILVEMKNGAGFAYYVSIFCLLLLPLICVSISYVCGKIKGLEKKESK